MKIKLVLLFSGLMVLSGCASTSSPINYISYTRTEIASVASTHFDTKQNALQRSLKPTFKKYGQPNGYVSGHMSASLEDYKDRLLGTGAFQAKFKLSKGSYWEIDGIGLTGLNEPVPTIHLVYNETDIEKFKSVLARSDVIVRKDQIFTVFEQKVDNQVLVTVYRTADIPETSEMTTLRFAPIYRGGLLP